MGRKDPFVQDLDDLSDALGTLATGGNDARLIEWTIISSAWKILKDIRKPENVGGWPVLTGVSRGKWGFEKIGTLQFVIFNNALVSEQRRARGVKPLKSGGGSDMYAQWTYAKGDGIARRPIAPEIVKRAIIGVAPLIEKSYFDRVERYLSKRVLKDGN